MPMNDAAAAARQAIDAMVAGHDQMVTEAAATEAILRARIAELEANQAPERQPFVRFVNWWCADGFRDGAPERHHLDEYGAGSPEVAAYRALAQRTDGTVWSFDTSSLGRDAARSEAEKVDSHKTLLRVPNVRHIRVFFGGAPPTWKGTATEHKRIAALKPGDTFLFSSLSTDWAAWRRFYAETPDQFRDGREPLCAFGHEREADLNVATTLRPWLDGNARVADILNNAAGYTTDHLVKIGLFFSQEIEKNPATPNREQLYGGQDFGLFGEDVYNPRAAAGYRSAAQLVGPIFAFAREVGRPTCIPELGGVRKASDATGAGRAKMIADIAVEVDKANAAA